MEQFLIKELVRQMFKMERWKELFFFRSILYGGRLHNVFNEYTKQRTGKNDFGFKELIFKNN